MPKICSIQEFVQEITEAIRKLSPEEKRAFREAWISQVGKQQVDRRFLKSCGINPDAD
ncbi:MAG TPA: hypothetical protein VHF01_16170 [Candidatus Acidoferrum sp.]|nr:hypothetical protein [Candidatus Acidoferrum sp.]